MIFMFFPGWVDGVGGVCLGVVYFLLSRMSYE